MPELSGLVPNDVRTHLTVWTVAVPLVTETFRQVQHDRLRQQWVAVLVGAVHFDFVRSFGFQARGLQPQHDHPAEGGRILVADQGVEARAEDVNETIGWRFGRVCKQGPIEPHPRAIIDGVNDSGGPGSYAGRHPK